MFLPAMILGKKKGKKWEKPESVLKVSKLYHIVEVLETGT